MGHHRNAVSKAALTVALIGFAASAQASVTWDIVGTASGEPDAAGTMTTPDIEFNCGFGPPADCPISGTLTIPAGALGGPGTTIDLGADPANVIVNIATSPPTVADDFFLLTIIKDGYSCNSSSSFVLQCDFDATTAVYDLVLTEQVPSVAIGNGNVVITGQLQVGGQIIGPVEPPTLYSIGDTGPAGGIVFLVTLDGLHGLEAAPADQVNAPWGCYSFVLPGANGTFVGTGEQNTADIIAGCTTADIAADIAADYSLGGFEDWFLPSKDELKLMYQMIGQGSSTTNVGGFSSGGYWSSSEVTDVTALLVIFVDGSEFDGGKNGTHEVRAVRAF